MCMSSDEIDIKDEYLEEFRKVSDPLAYEVLMLAYLTKNLKKVGTCWISNQNSFVDISIRKLLSHIILDENVYYILVFHNHVNGRNALPSEADMNILFILNFCCEFLDAKLLDFIITDEDGSLSCIPRLYIEDGDEE